MVQNLERDVARRAQISETPECETQGPKGPSKGRVVFKSLKNYDIFITKTASCNSAVWVLGLLGRSGIAHLVKFGPKLTQKYVRFE